MSDSEGNENPVVSVRRQKCWDADRPREPSESKKYLEPAESVRFPRTVDSSARLAWNTAAH